MSENVDKKYIVFYYIKNKKNSDIIIDFISYVTNIEQKTGIDINIFIKNN